MIKSGMEYFKKLVDAANPIVVQDNKSYIHSNGGLKALYEEMPERLQFGTLDALLKWGAKRSSELVRGEAKPYYVVDAFNSVTLLSPVFGEHNQRNSIATASVKMDGMGDRLKTYITEDLIIDLQTHFEPTPNRVKLINLLSNVTKEGGVTQSDDGVSQSIEVRDNVAFKSKTTIPNPIELNPYCTFAEIDVPARKYVFRVDNNLNWKLIKVNDPTWEHKTKELIGKHLKKLAGKMEVYV